MKVIELDTLLTVAEKEVSEDVVHALKNLLKKVPVTEINADGKMVEIKPVSKVQVPNTLYCGPAAAGKTTQIIADLKALLQEYPELRIGVSEDISEIIPNVPGVIAVEWPSEDIDLYVTTKLLTPDAIQRIVISAEANDVAMWFEVRRPDHVLDVTNILFEVKHITRK